MSPKNQVHNSQNTNDDIEETLAKVAAMQIAKRELDIYDAACEENYDLRQIPNYQAMKESLAAELTKAEKRHRAKRWFNGASRLVACLALASVLTTGVLYVTVDAARNTINNFFLELHDGYAILHGDEELNGSRAPLPENWAGQFTPYWVPDKFSNVTGTEMEFTSSLVYTTDNSAEMLLITAWSAEESPSIDREDMVFRRAILVQGVEASLYIKTETDQLYLDFAKNDYVVQICGDVTEQEIVKVAENLDF